MDRVPIKQSTKDGYDMRLKKLNNGQPIDNYAFLYDIDVIMDKISGFTAGTQRNYIIAIVQALRDVPVMKSMYEAYSEIMNQFNADLKVNNTKSIKQEANWVDQDQIDFVFKKLLDENIDLLCSKRNNITQTNWSAVTDTVLLALYVLQPPRRILDYMAMVIVKKLPKTLDPDLNYYALDTDTFTFQIYKTSGTYNTQTVVAPSKLATLLECYFKISRSQYMISKYDGSPYTKSYYITRILNKIFQKELGKSISVSMLRNIYLTDKFGSKIKELSSTAAAMGTSSSTIQNNYVKID